MLAQPLASRAAAAATATAASGRSLATDGHLAVGPRPGRLVVAPRGAVGRARRAGRAGPGTGARAVAQAGAVQGDDRRREADHLRVDVTGAGPERQRRPGQLARRPSAAASAGTPSRGRARPRPPASRRAAARPPARWPGPVRSRPWSWPGPGRPARTGRRPAAPRPARSPTPKSRTVTATAPESAADGHHGLPVLAVLDRVDQQVAQDPLDPAAVHLGDARLGGQPELDPGAAPLGQLLGHVGRLPDDVAHVDRLGVQGGRVGVVPADLQQVGEQRLEPLQLALQQLGRPGRRGDPARPWPRTARRRRS